ncbi:MAG: RNA polymerase sigma factor [Verrucomicrobiales bacterium]
MEDTELERLYDGYAVGLFQYFLSFTRGEADARDLLQDHFVKLARNGGCLDGVRCEKAFLYRMAHNQAIDWSRRVALRRAKACEIPPPATTGAHDPDAAQFREELEGAMALLPDEQSSVVQLKLWGGMTFELIAEIQGISANTAGSRYRYGIEKLRQSLAPIYREINE